MDVYGSLALSTNPHQIKKNDFGAAKNQVE
jgi:hypothetical protein